MGPTMSNEDAPQLSSEQRELIARLVEGALQIPAAERAEYLAREAGDDEQAYSIAMSIVDRDRTETGELPNIPQWLQGIDFSPGSSQHAPASRSPFAPGMMLGQYTLRKRLGEGAFGEVWLADRKKPAMTVAIKVLKPGVTGKADQARFEAEAQVLALLDHEGIAKIHDAGLGQFGEPYIAMEYIEGQPLTRYCDDRRLSLEQRLELMSRVCEAVHHAHQIGVIHRDLKPENILVTEVARDLKSLNQRDRLLHVDTRDSNAIIAQPKVVDFGLAKAINRNVRLSGQSLTVDFEKLMGTPEYMAPEQTVHDPLGVDTRADIFALGVILYEMVTGTLPLPRDEIHRRGIEEIIRAIRDTPRPALSERFSSFDAETMARTSHLRGGMPPERLAKLLGGRLQHLAITALRLEKKDRFTSAAAFARDIHHYLIDEPYEEAAAEPPLYRLRLAMRRNPLPYAAALLLVVAVVGVLSSLWLFADARASAAEAQQMEAIAERERLQREKYEIQSLQRADSLRDLLSFLLAIDQTLERLDGTLAVRGEIVAIALEHLEHMSGEAKGDPLLLRELAIAYDRVGDIQGGRRGANLGDLDGAIESFSKAREIREALLETDPDDTALLNEYSRSLIRSGDIYRQQGRMGAATGEYQAYLEMRERLSEHDRNDPQPLNGVAIAMQALGDSALAIGDMDAAKQYYNDSLSLRRQLVQLLPGNVSAKRLLTSALLRIAGMYEQDGDFETARTFYAEAIALREQLAEASDEGRWNRDLAVARLYMAGLYLAQDRPSDAGPYLHASLEAFRQRYEADEPGTHEDRSLRDMAYSLEFYARYLSLQGQDEDALIELAAAQSFALRLVQQSPQVLNRLTLSTIHRTTADILLKLNRTAEAIGHLEDAHEILMVMVGEDVEVARVTTSLEEVEQRLQELRQVAADGS